MKSILTIIILNVFLTVTATNYTSVTNGNWSNPITWGVAGIPLPTDHVTINHTVTIDDQYTVGGYWSVNGGTIIINNNGILQSGANVLGIAIQNGGTLTNNGQLNIPQLGNYNGNFTNNGTCNFSQLVYNLSDITNNGDIIGLDSLYTNGNFYNEAGSSLDTDSLWNEGYFTNSSTIILHEITNNGTFLNYNLASLTFRRMTNLNIFNNEGSLYGSLDMTNSGYFNLSNQGTFSLDRSFLNADSSNHQAVFIVEGTFDIGDSFYNADTIKGIDGHINVQDSSMNAGWMKETFYFCDATPPTASPFIDYNTGIIENGLRYCTSVNINNVSNQERYFFPNPATTQITFEPCSSIEIFDISGKKVYSNIQQKQTELNIEFLKTGIYFIAFKEGASAITKKLIIE